MLNGNILTCGVKLMYSLNILELHPVSERASSRTTYLEAISVPLSATVQSGNESSEEGEEEYSRTPKPRGIADGGSVLTRRDIAPSMSYDFFRPSPAGLLGVQLCLQINIKRL